MYAMERTNLVLAKILNRALENGVRHWSLSFRDLELSDEYASYFYPCVEWLEDEGLVRVGKVARVFGGLAEGSVENLVLTARGMAVLGLCVSFDGETEKISEAVAKASEDGGLHHRIGEVIGGVFGGFIKTIGN